MNEIRKYEDFHKDEIVCKIRNEVVHREESRGWHGERACPGLYEQVKKELEEEGIFPLEDMFGSWGKIEQHKPEFEFVVSVDFQITASTEEEALDLWAQGDYDDHEVRGCRKVPGRKDIHIIYSIDDHGIIKFNCTDGSSGSTPNQTEEQFRNYWTNHYKGKKVTYEKI